MIFSHFLESGRKSRGAPCPGPGPGLGLSPRPGPGRGPIPIDGAGGRPLPTGAPCARDRGRRRVPSGPSNSGHAQCVRSGPPIRSLGAKRFCERAVSARSGPPVRPSGQSDSGNAPDPCARGLRCVPRGKAIPGTRWVRTPGLRSACSGPSDLVARTWPRHC